LKHEKDLRRLKRVAGAVLGPEASAMLEASMAVRSLDLA